MGKSYFLMKIGQKKKVLFSRSAQKVLGMGVKKFGVQQTNKTNFMDGLILTFNIYMFT